MTVLDLLTSRAADLAAKSDADKAVAADQTKLTEDQTHAADLAGKVSAADATLTSALGGIGPVIVPDGTVYEVIAGSLRVFTPTPAGSATLPDSGPAPTTEPAPVGPPADVLVA